MDIDLDSLSASAESSEESIQKTCHTSEECLRKSLKVKHAKDEHINVMQGANIDNTLGGFESGDIDNVRSGESLYKTFTFEQTSDEDIEKCMAFWTSVMQKNLEPIKCSIVESTEMKIGKAEEEKKPSKHNFEEINARMKEAEAKIHDHYRKMWMTVLEKIQKSKLDEIKMYAKSRCKMCEAAIPPKEFSSNKDEIIQLNNWTTEKDTAPRPQKKLHSKESAVCVCEPIVKSEKSDISVNTVRSDRHHVPRDTNKYILRDLINQKKKTGAYRRWRDNTLELCTCGTDPCECNKNPAIVSIELPDRTCGCKQLNCHCQLKTLEMVAAEEEEPCMCGYEECVCNLKTEFSDLQNTTDTLETILTETTASMPSTPADILSSEFQSKDTLSKGVPDHKDPYTDHGPLKKDSKADVTKEGSDKGSCRTLDLPKCNCEGTCHCNKARESDPERNKEHKKEEGSKRVKDKEIDNRTRKSKNHKKKSSKTL